MRIGVHSLRLWRRWHYCMKFPQSRCRLLDWILRLEWKHENLVSINKALEINGKNWGDFYRWRVEQAYDSTYLRNGSKLSILDEIRIRDTSDYTAMNIATSSPKGLLLAIPHYGYFVLSIIALAQRLGENRQVMIFYDSPKNNSGNQMFDALNGLIFRDNPNVNVIHNTRSGLIAAIKGLRAGAIVIIMPDVYSDVEATYPVPFAGTLRSAPMGTALLARKTGSSIITAVSKPSKNREFETVFGPERHVTPLRMIEDPVLKEVASDYLLTKIIYEDMDNLMNGEYLYWQYSLSHFISKNKLYEFDSDKFPEQFSVFVDDPRLKSEPVSVVSMS